MSRRRLANWTCLHHDPASKWVIWTTSIGAHVRALGRANVIKYSYSIPARDSVDWVRFSSHVGRTVNALALSIWFPAQQILRWRHWLHASPRLENSMTYDTHEPFIEFLDSFAKAQRRNAPFIFREHRAGQCVFILPHFSLWKDGRWQSEMNVRKMNDKERIPEIKWTLPVAHFVLGEKFIYRRPCACAESVRKHLQIITVWRGGAS